jgi:tetratricopeptide (TPR) repeat protein
MSSRAEPLPKGLVAAVLALTLVVLGLGATILVIKLRPAELPTRATDRTIEIWRQRVAAAPDDDRPLVGLGLALLGADRANEARGAFEDALELNANNWVALTQLGILVADEDSPRAFRLLEDGAEQAPVGSKVIPLVATGDLYMELGDAKQAAAAYQQALQDSASVFEAHLGLAKALEALGKDRDALSEYEQAAQYDPANPEIADAIARLQGND